MAQRAAAWLNFDPAGVFGRRSPRRSVGAGWSRRVRSLCAVTAVLALGAGAGCDDQDAGDPPSEAARATAITSGAAEDTGEGAGRVSPEEAMDKALSAAAEAEGRSYCERAYNSVVSMIRGIQEEMGGQANVPHRDAFIEGCEALPEPMQRCMYTGYAISHQKECEAARKELDPETIEQVKGLMGTGQAAKGAPAKGGARGPTAE